MCDASLGRKGKGNDGSDLRIYEESECAQQGGIFHSNGECSKREGGSWSWDCRDLPDRTAPFMSTALPSVTMPVDVETIKEGFDEYKWYILGGVAVVGVIWWVSRD